MVKVKCNCHTFDGNNVDMNREFGFVTDSVKEAGLVIDVWNMLGKKENNVLNLSHEYRIIDHEPLGIVETENINYYNHNNC